MNGVGRGMPLSICELEAHRAPRNRDFWPMLPQRAGANPLQLSPLDKAMPCPARDSFNPDWRDRHSARSVFTKRSCALSLFRENVGVG